MLPVVYVFLSVRPPDIKRIAEAPGLACSALEVASSWRTGEHRHGQLERNCALCYERIMLSFLPTLSYAFPGSARDSVYNSQEQSRIQDYRTL